MNAVYPHTFTDSCIIFITFMSFMVKLYFSVFSVTSVVKNVFLCSFVCFVDDNRILIYGGGTMKTFYRRVARSSTQSCAEEKPESVNVCGYTASFTDSCIIFITFMFFMVNCIPLCSL